MLQDTLAQNFENLLCLHISPCLVKCRAGKTLLCRTFASVLVSAAAAEEEGPAVASQGHAAEKTKKRRKRSKKKKKKGHAAEEPAEEQKLPELSESKVDDHTGLASIGISDLLVEGRAAVRKTHVASRREVDPALTAKAHSFLADEKNCKSDNERTAILLCGLHGIAPSSLYKPHQ